MPACIGDGQQLGEFSLTIVLYGQIDRDSIRLPDEFAGIFTNADGSLFVETYNQLNAYFATVPGNYALNLRKLFLLNTNYADLASCLRSCPAREPTRIWVREYLAVLETDNATPYYLNLHSGEVAHTLILGKPDRAKRFSAVSSCRTRRNTSRRPTSSTSVAATSLSLAYSAEPISTSASESRDFTINPFLTAPHAGKPAVSIRLFRVLIEGRTGAIGWTSRRSRSYGTPSSASTPQTRISGRSRIWPRLSAS